MTVPSALGSFAALIQNKFNEACMKKEMDEIRELEMNPNPNTRRLPRKYKVSSTKRPLRLL